MGRRDREKSSHSKPLSWPGHEIFLLADLSPEDKGHEAPHQTPWPMDFTPDR